MKYIIYTLGCKVNQYETQAMETLLRSHGHEPAEDGEIADAVIINTCAVTAEAGRKSRQAINRLMDENPGAVAAVCGCYSQLSPDAAEKLGAKVIFGSGDRAKLVDAIEKAVISGEGERNIDKPFERRVFEELPAGATSGRTRAMLKVQDGCVNFCSYCIIPYTRGRLCSLPIEAVVKQASELDRRGFRELVITGIELASYGADLPGRPNMADVICACAEAAPHTRIRLGSLEPGAIDEDFCRRLSRCGNICRHFHLSLQSGNDAVLKAMNRKYDTAKFFEVTELLRKYFPGCGITADLIVGFPGESEKMHRETLEFLEKCAFSFVHVFPYSRRPGTVADKMDGQLDRATKEKRSKEARCLVEKMQKTFLEENVGKTLPVLFETFEDGFSRGHSDNYLLVRTAGDGLHGLVKKVRITGVSGTELIGTVDGD